MLWIRCVYPKFIEDASHLISKTYMTRVEGENTKVAALLGPITSLIPYAIPNLLRCWSVQYACCCAISKMELYPFYSFSNAP